MENKEIYGRVYLITNKINGKQYTGQTVLTIKERLKLHHDAAKYKKGTTAIINAMNKYGKENFEIEQIDVAYNQEELDLIEGIYIAKFNTLVPNGYNITEIINGKGRHSEETKEKISIKCKILGNTPERLKINSESGKKSRGKSYKKSSSKYVGVSVRNKKYKANIHYLNKKIHLGTYDLESDAAKAYDIAAIKYFGHDANLNFPELKQDYIDNKIHVEKNYKFGYGKSGEKNIKFIKTYNYWQFKWFSKTLNRNTTKHFKTLEEAIKFKNEKN